jgi:hypothetical protein
LGYDRNKSRGGRIKMRIWKRREFPFLAMVVILIIAGLILPPVEKMLAKKGVAPCFPNSRNLVLEADLLDGGGLYRVIINGEPYEKEMYGVASSDINRQFEKLPSVHGSVYVPHKGFLRLWLPDAKDSDCVSVVKIGGDDDISTSRASTCKG